jgi:branched-chain amino acid aminotransferase
MSSTVFLNGRWVSSDEAAVSIHDGGWMHGAGLFETMRAEYGRIFRLDAHLDRLMASAAALLTPIERPDLPLTSDFERLLEANGYADARVRLTVSAGRMDRIEEERERPVLTVVATASELGAYPAELYRRGMSVVVSRFRQNPADPTAGHKTTSYLPRLLALREAQQHRCGEALWFTPDPYLAEGCISNVFLWKNETLLTPPLTTPVLPGIARAVLLECASEQGIKVDQRPLTINDLLDADEVLLTNTIMQVLPVINVERRDIASGKPGEIAKTLLKRYRAKVETECQNVKPT